jgi:uncharacterized sulfatase
MTRREFLRYGGAAGVSIGLAGAAAAPKAAERRPNILFCIADDWSWPHAGVYGDKVVKTPTFDRIARQGVLFRQAHCAAPSCTPSRGSVLTGQMFYRLEEGANLWSTLPAKFPVYTDLLAAAGYHVGCTRKGWGPGDVKAGGRTQNAAGRQYRDFTAFLAERPKGKPFCFWFGSHEPHRGYRKGSGLQSGKRTEDVTVPPFLPDCQEIRSDILDYYVEVEQFDSQVAGLVQQLEQIGELDGTLVVVTSDNGMPFPRAKSNLYDCGTHMPLAVRWPAKVKGGRVVEDFISFTDFAATFLEAAGCEVPACMTGRSFLGLLTGGRSGRVDPKRDRAFVGKERHTDRREGGVGYPCRAVRTRDYLYIRNFAPERWPAGDPPGYGDIDGSPSKSYVLDHRDDEKVRRFFELACAKRPAEELFDLKRDPAELTSVAGREEYRAVQEKLSAELTAYLKATNDPRVVGGGEKFDQYLYRGGGGPRIPAKTGKAPPAARTKRKGAPQ